MTLSEKQRARLTAAEIMPQQVVTVEATPPPRIPSIVTTKALLHLSVVAVTVYVCET